MLAGRWAIDVHSRLELSLSSEEGTRLQSIARETADSLGSIIEMRPQVAAADEYGAFHGACSDAIEQALETVANRIGVEAAQKVRRLGLVGNAASEFVWHVLLRRLQKSEIRQPGSVATLLRIDDLQAQRLMEKVNRSLALIPERGALDSQSERTLSDEADVPLIPSDAVVDMALDLIRCVVVPRLLKSIREESSGETVEGLLRWASQASDSLGVHKTVQLVIH